MIPSASPFKCRKGKQKIRKWLKSEQSSSAPPCRPAQTEIFLLFQGNLSDNGLCRFSPDACFCVLGQKKKKKKLELSTGTCRAWKNHFQMFQNFLIGILCGPQCLQLPAAAWAFLIVLQTEKKLDRLSCRSGPAKSNHAWKWQNLSTAQLVECVLNKCRRVKVKKEGNVMDVTTVQFLVGKYPVLML